MKVNFVLRSGMVALFFYASLLSCKSLEPSRSQSNTQSSEQSVEASTVELVYYKRRCGFSESIPGKTMRAIESCFPYSYKIGNKLNTRPYHEEVVVIARSNKGDVVRYLPIGWGMYNPKTESLYANAVLEELNTPAYQRKIVIMKRASFEVDFYDRFIAPRLVSLYGKYPREKYRGYGSVVSKICMDDGWNCQDMAERVWQIVESYSDHRLTD